MNNLVELLSLRAPTVGDLPPPNTQRWVVRRKAAVVAAVRSGTITIEEVLRRYQLTEEEFLSWLKAMALRDCAPRASSNTVARVRRATPDRGAEVIVGLSV